MKQELPSFLAQFDCGAYDYGCDDADGKFMKRRGPRTTIKQNQVFPPKKGFKKARNTVGCAESHLLHNTEAIEARTRKARTRDRTEHARHSGTVAIPFGTQASSRCGFKIAEARSAV